MPTTIATRLLNNVVNGTVNTGQLQTALTDVPTYNHWQTLYSSASTRAIMFESDTAWSAIKNSDLALASLVGSPQALKDLLNNPEKLADLRASRTRMQVAANADTTGLGLFNGFSDFANYPALFENKISSGTGYSINHVTYVNGVWIGSCSDATIITSTNAINWVSQKIPVAVFPTATSILGATYGNGNYVIVGSEGKLATSPDLITWTVRTVSTWGTTAAIRSIIYNSNNTFVICGSNGQLATASTSGNTDPSTWTWTMRTANQGTSILYNVCLLNGLYMVVGAVGVLSTATDPTSTWTARTSLSSAGDVSSIAWNGASLYVACGGVSTNKIWSASDPTSTWTARTATGAVNLKSVAFGAGLFVVVGQTGEVFTSADAITWVKRSPSTQASLSSVAFANSQFVIGTNVSLNEAQICISTDGKFWKSSAFPVGLKPGLEIFGATFANNLFLMGGSTDGTANTSKIAFSPDALNWYSTLVSTTIGGGINCIAYGNGLYVVGGNSTVTENLYTSTDLETWTARSNPILTGSTPVGGIAYGNAMFVAASGSGTPIVISSPDGATWTTRTSSAGTNTSVNHVSFVGGKFFITGSGNASSLYALQYSYDGITWATPNSNGGANDFLATTSVLKGRVAYGNGLYVVGGAQGQLWTSNDGINWISPFAVGVTGIFGNTTTACNSVMFTNKMFVAVGDDGRVAYSYNATNWFQVPVKPGQTTSSHNIKQIAYGAGVHLLVGGDVGIPTNQAFYTNY